MIRSLVFALAVAASLAVQTKTATTRLSSSPFWTVPATPPRRPSGNPVLARNALYDRVDEGDAEQGRARLEVTQLLGGERASDLRTSDALVVPSHPRDFDLPALAFAPYPWSWPGAAGIEKVVVVDKTTQTWAAYDRGQLACWGPASTGAAATPTPSGRFTMELARDGARIQ